MPTWTSTYAVDHALIDRQHQELFRRADALLEALHQGRAGAELEQLLGFLQRYVAEHFAAEEQLMADASYPAAQRHREEHAEFARRFRRCEETYRAEGATPALALDLRDTLRGWLVTHVCTVDLQLAAFLRTAKVTAG